MGQKLTVAVLTAFILLFGSPSAGRAGSEALKPYIEAAKKEGTVKIGITVRMANFGKPSGKKYIDAFNRRYPFLNVEFKRIGGSRERERVLAEMTAGMINYDVATVSTTMVDTLREAKLPLLTDWQKLSVRKELVHPDHVGVSLRTQVYGIGYNREFASDEEANKFTWETCTDPKWQGKSAMDDRPRHLEVLYKDEAWGSEKTLDYARRWAANKPAMEASRSTAAQKLAVGAYSLICGMPRGQVRHLAVHGGVDTVGIVFPEPVPVNIGDLIYVPRKAKHPNAAVLFLAWTGTQEAQNILDEADFTGHPGFEGNEINRVVKGKKAIYSTWEDAYHADDVLAKILMRMGFPVVR
jgi:ABC-type Fe3+ transport system substrate-binding protein